MNIYGIDTDEFHPITDPEAVRTWLREKNGGRSPGFVIARLGYSSRSGRGGLILDRDARSTLAWCNRLGVPCGAYVYCYDTTPEASRRTMEDAIEAVRDFRLDYPIVYDMEYGTTGNPPDVYRYNDAANKANNTAMIRAAMQTIEQAGYYAMVYCSRDFFLHFTDFSQLRAYDKWEAAYVSTDTNQIDNGIWQYSSTGRVPGIEGDVDLDLAYKDYPFMIKEAGLNGHPHTPILYTVKISRITGGDFDAVQAALLPVIRERKLEPYYSTWEE